MEQARKARARSPPVASQSKPDLAHNRLVTALVFFSHFPFTTHLGDALCFFVPPRFPLSITLHATTVPLSVLSSLKVLHKAYPRNNVLSPT
jgi:hypothetical protein